MANCTGRQVLKGVKAKLYLASTYETAVTLTDITAADPAVITTDGTDSYTDGDIVVVCATGMAQIDGQIARLNGGGTSDQFQLEGIDSSEYDAFTAGTVQRITAWTLIPEANVFTAPQADPEQLDVTTLLDSKRQFVFGFEGQQEIEYQLLFKPTDAAAELARGISRNQNQVGVYFKWPSGHRVYVNSWLSAGDGWTQEAGGVATTTWRGLTIAYPVFYSGDA